MNPMVVVNLNQFTEKLLKAAPFAVIQDRLLVVGIGGVESDPVENESGVGICRFLFCPTQPTQGPMDMQPNILGKAVSEISLFVFEPRKSQAIPVDSHSRSPSEPNGKMLAIAFWWRQDFYGMLAVFQINYLGWLKGETESRSEVAVPCIDQHSWQNRHFAISGKEKNLDSFFKTINMKFNRLYTLRSFFKLLHSFSVSIKFERSPPFLTDINFLPIRGIFFLISRDSNKPS